ncbi:WhiB family transcriptional regulator [Streptomyces griseorubiginosus]|uniref:WhiB family transcriptional regulator n=1 Tax=Streptomyces griseorubiginosus TaxID=67304 RepID=UPI0036E68D26
MNRTDTAATAPAQAARFDFPHSPTPTRCQRTPQMFDFTNGDRAADPVTTGRRLELAREACSSCSIVADCLKWALVNKDLTRHGVWAATTPVQRTELRKRMADRLGPDWAEILAKQEQARRERAAAARHQPLPVNAARIVRLDREVNGPMPTGRLLAPAVQQRNLARLVHGLTA